MAQHDWSRVETVQRDRTAAIDEGLQGYMTKVYALMTGAMLITGVVAYVVGSNEALLSVFRDPMTMSPTILGWIVMFAPLAVVLFFGSIINRLSTEAAQMFFWGFGALMGLSISWIFAYFTNISIAQTFFATAAGFGALSIYGYTTKKDLSGWGSFLIMGVIGLIVAMLLNILFFQSEILHMAVSVLGVLIFAGLTAYDTQQIKNEYLHLRGMPGAENYLEKGAIMGALHLYINFLNMFMFLLQFLGQRE